MNRLQFIKTTKSALLYLPLAGMIKIDNSGKKEPESINKLSVASISMPREYYLKLKD